MKDLNTLIGDRVRFYRTSRKLTLEALGERLQQPLSYQMLARYEAGEAHWRADLVCEVAKLLRIDVRLLLAAEEDGRVVKGTPEWKADKYKNTLLNISEKAREAIYRLIDVVAGSP